MSNSAVSRRSRRHSAANPASATSVDRRVRQQAELLIEQQSRDPVRDARPPHVGRVSVGRTWIPRAIDGLEHREPRNDADKRRHRERGKRTGAHWPGATPRAATAAARPRSARAGRRWPRSACAATAATPSSAPHASARCHVSGTRPNQRQPDHHGNADGRRAVGIDREGLEEERDRQADASGRDRSRSDAAGEFAGRAPDRQQAERAKQDQCQHGARDSPPARRPAAPAPRRQGRESSRLRHHARAAGSRASAPHRRRRHIRGAGGCPRSAGRRRSAGSA